MRRFSKVGGCDELLCTTSGVLAFFRAPGLTRLRGVEHWVHLWALGQFKQVQRLPVNMSKKLMNINNNFLGKYIENFEVFWCKTSEKMGYKRFYDIFMRFV